LTGGGTHEILGIFEAAGRRWRGEVSSDRERREREGGGAHDAAHDDATPDLAQSIRTDPAYRARYMRRKARKAVESAKNPAEPIPNTTGAALPEGVRHRMEPQLGADLSGVRVHAGGESAHAADQLGARAFTVGNDVHFGAGQFSPNTKEGDKLIAHELTHVVQGQKSGVQRKADSDAHATEEAEAQEHVSQPDEPAEKEADAVADHVGEQLHGDGGGQQHAADAANSTPTAAGCAAPMASGGKKIARKAGPQPTVGGGRRIFRKPDDKKKDAA
jgi:hypothetical protein